MRVREVTVKVEQLKQRLLEEGCNPINFSIGPGSSDLSCLENQDGTWRVFYTERGKDEDPIFESADEEASLRVLLRVHHQDPTRSSGGVLQVRR